MNEYGGVMYGQRLVSICTLAIALAAPGLGCEQEPEGDGEEQMVPVEASESAKAEVAEEVLPIDPSSGGSVAEHLRDISLAANVKLKLAEQQGVDISRIDLKVNKGQVTLLGEVASQEISSRVANAAQSVEGVRQVVNQLTAPEAEPTVQAQPQTAPPVAQTTPQQTEPVQPQQAPAAATYYTIRRGDNLGSIARKHGTTVAQLQKLNNLRGTNIRAGQKLRVK